VSEEAGIDIDMDAELARIQGTIAGIDHPVAREIAVAGKVVQSDRTIEFMGKTFRIADRVGLMPLLKFSAFADTAVSDPRALGALYAMLRDCIHQGNPGCGTCEVCAPERCGECRNCTMVAEGEAEDGLPCTVYRPDPTLCKDFDAGDWHAFEEHAMQTKAEADDLMDVVTKVIEKIAGRPTRQPSPSSTGRRSTRDASMARSSARRAKGSRS
jgi:hypothetical protein